MIKENAESQTQVETQSAADSATPAERVSIARDRYDKFLSLLGSDREQAGEQEERIRTSLHFFFSKNEKVRSRADEGALTDRTIDRVIERIDRDEIIENPGGYTHGVAKNVLREYLKSPDSLRTVSLDALTHRDIAAKEPHIETVMSETELRNSYLECVRSCFNKLKPKQREMFLRAKKIDSDNEKTQEDVAHDLGLTTAALSNRVFRIRQKLEKCARTCIRNKTGMSPKILSIPL